MFKKRVKAIPVLAEVEEENKQEILQEEI